MIMHQADSIGVQLCHPVITKVCYLYCLSEYWIFFISREYSSGRFLRSCLHVVIRLGANGRMPAEMILAQCICKDYSPNSPHLVLGSQAHSIIHSRIVLPLYCTVSDSWCNPPLPSKTAPRMVWADRFAQCWRVAPRRKSRRMTDGTLRWKEPMR